MNVNTDEMLMQKLMNQAYAEWRVNDWTQVDFYAHLHTSDHNQLIAVVLGNLNYQVENGGWSQWIFNGYTKSAEPYILDILQEINTANSKTVEEYVRKAIREMHAEERFEANKRSGWSDDDYDYELDLNAEDDGYYAINEAFMLEVNAYLENKINHAEQQQVKIVSAAQIEDIAEILEAAKHAALLHFSGTLKEFAVTGETMNTSPALMIQDGSLVVSLKVSAKVMRHNSIKRQTHKISYTFPVVKE
jgi:hypothetical protein